MKKRRHPAGRAVAAGKATAKSCRAWLWVPLLSFARGIVLVALMSVAMVMFKRLGVSNTWASFGTALLSLPFVFRQLFHPIVIVLPGRGWWLVGSQVAFCLSMFGVAWSLDPKGDGSAVWVCLSLASLVGAFHDVLSGDFCNSLLGNRKPSRLSEAVSLALLAAGLGLGITLMIAGDMEVLTRDVEDSWGLAFKVLAFVMLLVAVLMAISLPHGMERMEHLSFGEEWSGLVNDVRRWWTNSHQWAFALFVVIASLHEFFVWKGVLMFLGDPGSIGGLSLGPQEVAFAQSTLGVFAMMVGFLIGHAAVRRDGLRRWVLPMILLATVPDALLLYLAYFMPSSLSVVSACLMVESLGCGFGMAGFVSYVRYYGRGRHLPGYGDSCMALLMLSVLLAGVFTGIVQDVFGYRRFFILVVLLSVLAALSPLLLRLTGKSRPNK